MKASSRLFSSRLKPEFGTPGPRVAGGELPAHLYGVIAEFANAEDLLHAVHEARKEGYQVMEAYTPYPDRGAERRDRPRPVARAAPRPRRRDLGGALRASASSTGRR